MDTDLRIPVTTEQQKVIIQVIAGESSGFAAVARQMLLEAAKQRIKEKTRDLID